MDKNKQRELEKKHKIPPGWLANGQLAKKVCRAYAEIAHNHPNERIKGKGKK